MEKIKERISPVLSSKNDVLSLVLSVLACLSLGSILKETGDRFAYSNSILALPVLVGIFISIRSFWKYSKRILICSSIVGLLFAASQVLGRNILLNDRTDCKDLTVWFSILFLTPLAASLFGHLFGHLDKWTSTSNYKISSYKIFFISWAIIFAIWIPVLITAYPGVYSYDAPYQISYCKEEFINLKHPIAHTLMLNYFVVKLGDQVLHNKEMGYCIYSVIQMLVLSGTMAYSIKYLVRKGCSRWFIAVVMGLFAFLPVNPILGMSSTKDVYFSAFGLLYTVLLLELLEKQGKVGKLHYVLTGITLLLTMTFRSQGFYVFLVLVPVAFILLRGKRIRVAIFSVIVAALYILYSGPFTTHVLKGIKLDYTKQEYFSVPVMQMMRVFHNENGSLTPEQAEQMKAYIPNYEWNDGHGIADPYKNWMNVTLLFEQPKDFIILWWDVGVNNTVDYVDSWARLTIGLWYCDMNYPDREAYHYYWDYDLSNDNPDAYVILERHTPEKLQWLSDFYQQLSREDTYQKIPVVSMLFSSGVYFWCIVIFGVWSVIHKKYKYLVVVGYPLIYWMTMLLGPVVLYRYVYLLALVIPVMAGVMLTSSSNEKSLPEKSSDRQ